MRRACARCGYIHFTDPKVGVGVVVLAGDKITVRLFFTHVSGGDLDMKLYSNEADALSGYGSVDSSTSGTSNEEVEHTATADATAPVPSRLCLDTRDGPGHPVRHSSGSRAR